MFTGIVERTVPVVARQDHDSGCRLGLEFSELLGEVSLGQSIAVNGTCLTVGGKEGFSAVFELAGETLRKTGLRQLRTGAVVNIERALRLGDRLDGHLVQGHVDGVGKIRRLEPEGEDTFLEVATPKALLTQIIPEGSITVDGISLTVARLLSDGFVCTIIPHTLAVTNLGVAKVGDSVNLEVDMVGKWIRRILETSGKLPGLE